MPAVWQVVSLEVPPRKTRSYRRVTASTVTLVNAKLPSCAASATGDSTRSLRQGPVAQPARRD